MTDRPTRITASSGEDYLIVSAHRVERWSAAAAFEHVMAALGESTGGDAMRTLAVESLGFAGDPSDDAAVARCVAESIADGRFVPVVIDEPTPAMRPVLHRPDPWSTAVPISSLAPSAEPEFAWLSIELLDHLGSPFSGVDVTLVHCDGRRDRVVLDRAGRYISRTVSYPGPTRVELPARLESPPRSPQGLAMDGFQRNSGDIEVVSKSPGPIVIGALDRHHRIIVVPDTRAACVRLVGMLFELNKTFLLPGALEGIRLLPRMYERFPGAGVLVVGHTDRTGKRFRNDSLSLERAESVVAYMTDDVEAWLSFYGEEMDASRRWGRAEDLAMLASLPRNATPYYSADHAEHSVDAATRRFQEAHGLTVDGDCGPVTRRALVAEYMALDGTTLPLEIDAVAHGCGEHFPAIPSDDEVESLENRRVEIFFFEDGIDPQPGAENSTAESLDYAAWRAAVREERTFRPGATGHGRVIVETDYDVGYAQFHGLVVELRSEDHAYVRRIDPRHTPQYLGRTLAFEFTDVPKASFLTCVAMTDGGDEDVLFEDLPFWELSAQHRSGGDVSDPFAVDPDADDEDGEEGALE